MKSFQLNSLTFLIATAALSGCGGSGSTSMTSGPGGTLSASVNTGNPLFENVATGASSPLRFVAVTNDGSGSNGDTGSLDHSDGRITAGILRGQLNSTGTEIDLAGGGIAELTNPADAEYLRIFRTEGTGADRFGVVGIPTDRTDIPNSGSAIYTGLVSMQATNSTDSYALTGDATISATWGSSATVTSRFNDLSGSGDVTGNISDAGTLTISSASVADGAFEGGTLRGTGTVFGGLPTTADLSESRGEFFGPDAKEVGGVIGISSTGFDIIGVYSGD